MDDIQGIEGYGDLEVAVQGVQDDIQGVKDEVGALADTEVGEISNEIGATGKQITNRKRIRNLSNSNISAINARLSKLEGSIRKLATVSKSVVRNAANSTLSSADMTIYQNSQACSGAAGAYTLSFTTTTLTQSFGWIGLVSASAATVTLTKVGATPITDPGGSIQLQAGIIRWFRMSPRQLTSGQAALMSVVSTAANQVFEVYAVPPCRDPESYVKGSVNS